MWIGNLSASPHCHPIPEQSGSPTTGMAVPGMASGLASRNPRFTYTVDTFRLSNSLCREMSLSCNPKKIQTHTCGMWRNHWLPKESIKIDFSLSHVCERHTPTMGDKHVSFCTLIVLMGTSALLLLVLLLPPVSASICADVGQSHL